MNQYFIIAAGIALIATGFLVRVWIDRRRLLKKYRGVIDAEAEVARQREQLESVAQEIESTREGYKEKRKLYDSLLQEIGVVEESLEFTSYGLYSPHFDFDTSEDYKDEIKAIRSNQKGLIKDEEAVRFEIEWTVEGSAAKGRRMMKQNARLMLRAFNGECDAAISKVKWNNIERMEVWIKRAYDALNKIGQVQQMKLTRQYIDSKLDELHLVHEYEEKRQAEREEQRQIREQMREEEKVRKEIEKAQREAEAEEVRYEKALEDARKELAEAGAELSSELQAKVDLLEKQLSDAHSEKERAISRAQLTRSGHVYVISNIGSFGEDVYKIGMTRRLDPMDRVKELGDASVPFRFDVHAIIFSEDAPTLETKLHHAFDGDRLNLVNSRKEFFEVSLEDIEKVVHEHHGEIEFTKIAEAKEFRETEAMRETSQGPVPEQELGSTSLPQEI